MQDRPTSVELLQAVREFLEGDVASAITDRGLRYRLRIALHVLAIVEREMPGEESRLRAEFEDLQRLLGLPRTAPPAEGDDLRRRVLEMNRTLCERIRAGDADREPWRERVFSHVQRLVETKLGGSNPERLDTFRAGLRATGARPGD